MRRTIGYLLATIVVCTILANTVSAGELEDQLINSARSGRVDEVKSLLDKGANINARDAKGQTALIWGIQNIDIVRLLIEKGADMNVRDEYGGNTALMYAVSSPKADVVRLLIEKGANLNVTDKLGLNTALSLAQFFEKGKSFGQQKQKEIEDIVRMLERAGAKLPVGYVR